MKQPAYRHIFSYLAQKNRFLYMEDIVFGIQEEIETGRSLAGLYVRNKLRKLIKKGLIVQYTDKSSRLTSWGLPCWLDLKNEPHKSHFPIVKSPSYIVKPFGINTCRKL